MKLCSTVEQSGSGLDRFEFSLGMFAVHFIKCHATTGEKFLNAKRSLPAVTSRHQFSAKRDLHTRAGPDAVRLSIGPPPPPLSQIFLDYHYPEGSQRTGGEG